MTKLYWKLLRIVRLRGCRIVATSFHSNLEIHYLILNRTSVLGRAGDIIVIPKDRIIYTHIYIHGFWEKKESYFLAKSIDQACQNLDRVYIELGANIGIVARQVLNQTESDISVVLIEPLDFHLYCLDFNIRELRFQELTILPFAVSKNNGFLPMYINESNLGNSSLQINSLLDTTFRVSEVSCISPVNLEEFIPQDCEIFVKSDIEGMDLEILSALPAQIWDKMSAMVLEIASGNKDCLPQAAVFLERARGMKLMNWQFDQTKRILDAELYSFIGRDILTTKNLYLKREV